jgi:hypothetical protein
MQQEHWGGYCSHCNKPAMFVRDVERCNHLVHAIVTLFLCGAWLPFWLVFAMTEKAGPWLCTVCGHEWTQPPISKTNHHSASRI